MKTLKKVQKGQRQEISNWQESEYSKKKKNFSKAISLAANFHKSILADSLNNIKRHRTTSFHSYDSFQYQYPASMSWYKLHMLTFQDNI